MGDFTDGFRCDKTGDSEFGLGGAENEARARRIGIASDSRPDPADFSTVRTANDPVCDLTNCAV